MKDFAQKIIDHLLGHTEPIADTTTSLTTQADIEIELLSQEIEKRRNTFFSLIQPQIINNEQSARH